MTSRKSRKNCACLGHLGTPPIMISRDDITILAGMAKGQNQVQIAARLQRSPSAVCRRVKILQDHQLVITSAKTGERVPNPVFFPRFAGKTPSPVVTSSGTLPGKKYTIHLHNVQADCEVMPSSMLAYQKLRPTFKLLNHMEYWDRLVIEDKDLGFFGMKRFGNPHFIVISTPKKLFFYPWGWGNTDDEAEADAKRGAEELHDYLEKMLRIKLGFAFHVISPSGKRQPDYALHAMATPAATTPVGTSPAPVPPLAVQAPQLVVKGNVLKPDISHPDDIESTGKAGGRTLSEIARDLERIPQIASDTVAAQLQRLVQEAVAQVTAALIPAMAQGISQAMAPLTVAIKDAVAAGIQQGLSQVSQSQPTKPPSGQYT
ncbi:MAG: hypothetical protein Q6373_004520 [Candidatus Sigynarchaeota archaeon]